MRIEKNAILDWYDGPREGALLLNGGKQLLHYWLAAYDYNLDVSVYWAMLIDDDGVWAALDGAKPTKTPPSSHATFVVGPEVEVDLTKPTEPTHIIESKGMLYEVVTVRTVSTPQPLGVEGLL